MLRPWDFSEHDTEYHRRESAKKTWYTHDETNLCSEVKRNAQKEEGDLLKQLYNIYLNQCLSQKTILVFTSGM